MTAACRLGANWRHYHMTTVRCWFKSPQSIHCWKHYNSLFVCYWLFPPTFSFLKHLPFMNAASWACNQFLMDAWDGFAITGSFFSKNFACTQYTHTVHIDRNNLWSAYWNGFHILIMRRNDMTLTHLSLLSLRWDWYWFQAWSAHDTERWITQFIYWIVASFEYSDRDIFSKNLCMHNYALQKITRNCKSVC